MNDDDRARLAAARDAMTGADLAAAWRELGRAKASVYSVQNGAGLLDQLKMLGVAAVTWPFAHMKQR